MITRENETDLQPDVQIQPVHTPASIWREALLPFLGTRLVLLLVGLLAELYLLPLLKSNPLLPSVSMNTHLPDALWLMWKRFDAGFYVDIAEFGYWPASTLKTASNWIFLPLYPLLMYPFGHLFGGSDAAFDIAGIFVSNAAALVAITYLYLLVRRESGSRIASRTILYLAVFPTSFFLSAIYSEAVFLACAVACIYYARQHRWWLAGLCGGLASLARVQGLALVVPVAWEYWQFLSDRYAPLPELREMPLLERANAWLCSRLYALLLAARAWRNWFVLLAIALIPLGLLPFLLYSQVETGDFLATIHNHSVGWGRYFEYPWRTLIFAFTHPLATNAMEWNFWALNITMIVAFLGFTVWAFRRLPIIYALYTLVMVVLPLCTASINSISRYYLIIFPALILLALWSNHEEKQHRHFLILCLFASIQAVFMIFFVLGLPLIA
ncbi:MAG TPA: hypothetical protein VNE38_12125 [Ktedonobacteraceae bacterium]|nr:hypothetical protein [Ktedonobacteraceae bacterium]